MLVAHPDASRMLGRLVLSCMALAVTFWAFLVLAYNPIQDQVSGVPVPARWAKNSSAQTTPVTWNLNPNHGSNVDDTSGTNPVPLATAVSNAFNLWQQTQLSGQTANVLNIMRGSDSTLTDPRTNDCLNVISFSASSGVNFPTGAVAFTQISTATGVPPFTYTCTDGSATTTETCNLPSCLIDADMEFNPKENFSTSTPPLAKHFDVQATGSHEFGHVLGLDHSGIAHSMMFPFGDTGLGQQRNLAVDDVVGIAFLYPAPSFASLTGTLSGTITLNGTGIFASHLVAVDANTGAAVLDGLTNPGGTYKLIGVPPGTYNVLALPLSGVYSLDDFSGWSCGYGESSPPCCDPKTDSACTQPHQSPPTNYTGTFH